MMKIWKEAKKFYDEGARREFWEDQNGKKIMKILNLTQHPASAEQLLVGVIEPANKERVKELLTFAAAPTKAEMSERAEQLAAMAKDYGCEAAMIGGAPYFMSVLEKALTQVGVKPLYSFTARQAVETVLEDGTVQKTSVFKHVGWVEV